jgi:hypothetical protein
MFSKLFLSEKDIEAIQRALTRNPLLASLLMLSPMEAFKYLNLMPRFLDALLPSPTEDSVLVRELLRALEEGRTVLDRPQAAEPIITPAPEQAVTAKAADTLGTPDVALQVSKATLQRAVRLYAERDFKSQEFVFAVQRWLDVNARGEAVELDLDEGRARIMVKLNGTFAFRQALAPLDALPRKLAFPIEIDLRAAVAVDAANQLFLSVGEGQLSIVDPPLPARVASDLVAKIAAAVPSIPLVQVPTRFEIPGEPPAALELRLSRVGVNPAGLSLEFHLDD